MASYPARFKSIGEKKLEKAKALRMDLTQCSSVAVFTVLVNVRNNIDTINAVQRRVQSHSRGDFVPCFFISLPFPLLQS